MGRPEIWLCGMECSGAGGGAFSPRNCLCVIRANAAGASRVAFGKPVIFRGGHFASGAQQCLGYRSLTRAASRGRAPSLLRTDSPCPRAFVRNLGAQVLFAWRKARPVTGISEQCKVET